MSFERNKGPIYLRLNIYFLIVFENTIIVETLLTFWHEYVRVKLRSLVRSRALRDIFETGDKDIKKGRATSCPAGGHWRGINHPCEGLHFNAWGWISNARARERAQKRDCERDNQRDCRCNRPAILCNTRAVCRLSEVHIPRYRCSGRVSGKPVQNDADDKESRRRSETGGLVLFFHSPLFFILL